MGEIEKAVAAIRAQGGTDDDVKAYLKSQGFAEAERKPPRGVRSPVAIRAANANDPERQVTIGDELARVGVSALDAATFGGAGLLADMLSGPPGSFQSNRDARKAQYDQMSTLDKIGSSVAGALANPVTSFLGPAKAGTGLLRVAGKGATEGMLQGGATAFGENVGTSTGTLGPTLTGATVGGLFGAAAAPIAAKIAGRGMDKTTEAASRRLLNANEADAAQSFQVPVLNGGQGMPTPMAIDRAGPSVTAEVRAATRTPAAHAQLKTAFTNRESALPSALNAGVKDAKATEQSLLKARAAQADQDYSNAVEATKGIAVETPSLDALLQTPTGRAAWNEVVKSRPDLVLAEGDAARALPEVTRTAGGIERPAGFESFDASSATTKKVPDAEAIHLMTRYLRNWAKGETGQLFPEGVNAESAANAAKLLDKAKAELPVEFQIANNNYAEFSDKIDALRMGLSPWKNNPNPLNRKANKLAVATVRQAVKKMTPEQKALVREGKAFDLVSRFNDNGLNPATAVERMDRPKSALATEIRAAGGLLGDQMRAWNTALERQAAVLPTTAPSATPPPSTDLFRDVAGGVSMNPGWWATLTGRRIAGETLSARDAAKRAASDLAVAKTAVGSPDAIDKAIASLVKMDKAKGEMSRRAAGLAGRAGGLLTKW